MEAARLGNVENINNYRSLRIAFYGKGGIGKSTLASNVAAAFFLF